jgi:dipeptidyl-peptidase-4
MKLPADNAEGYDASAPLAFVEGLRGALLLVHGDADDNVHAQNSFKLVRALIDADKAFELMVYPGRTHSILGKADRRHLYAGMTRFFDRHLMRRKRRPAPPRRRRRPRPASEGLSPPVRLRYSRYSALI